MGGSGGVPAGFQGGSRSVCRVPVVFQPIFYGGSGGCSWGYYNINMWERRKRSTKKRLSGTAQRPGRGAVLEFYQHAPLHLLHVTAHVNQLSKILRARLPNKGLTESSRPRIAATKPNIEGGGSRSTTTCELRMVSDLIHAAHVSIETVTVRFNRFAQSARAG